MRISKLGDFAAMETEIGVFTAEITAEDRTPFTGAMPYLSDSTMPLYIAGFKIVPYGDENNLPMELRKILNDNHIAIELLQKKIDLIWGQGPDMYMLDKKDGKRVKTWVEDKEIRSWLNDWDYEEYIEKATTDVRYMSGHYTKYNRNRGFRIGQKPFIANLKHVSNRLARLEWPDARDNVNHIITGYFDRSFIQDFRKYPVWDKNDPFKYATAMRYSNIYSFAMDGLYSIPTLQGMLNWIKLSSSLPTLLMNFNVNSASIRYHIKSPSLYWQKKQEELEKNCQLKNIEYKDSMLEDLKDTIYKKFAEGLVGIEKAGKMITTEEIYDELGQDYVGWKVETIDQKVKNYIEAQINVVKRADFEITAGFGLHPALSNLSADGNLPSGSEQLYAYKLYLNTSVDIAEMVIFRDINNAIAVNFPKKKVKLGFYHESVAVESQVSPSNRIKNN